MPTQLVEPTTGSQLPYQYAKLQGSNVYGMVWYGILEFNVPLDTV